MDLSIKHNSIKIVQVLLATVIILVLLSSIGFFQISNIFLHLDWSFLLLACICYLLNNILMSVRLKKIIRYLGHKLRFRIVFLSHMSGMLLSDFTPGRSGYFYVALAMNKKGVPLPKGFAAITSTYIYDLLFKVALAFIAIYYFFSTITGLPSGYIMYLIIILLFLIIAAYFLIMYPGEILQDLCQKNKYLKYVLDLGVQSRSIQKIAPYIVFISFLGWILRGLEWYFIARSLGGEIITLIGALLLNPLLTLLSLIPITPAGMGIQEIGIVGLLGLIGVSVAVATAFAFLTRFIEILIDLIGVKSFFSLDTKKETLLKHYNSIEGDIDENAYNSDWCVQRFWQRRRTDTIKKMLVASDGDIIVDIGCGSGVQLRALKIAKPSFLIGTDVNRNALVYAKNKNIPQSEFIIADAQNLPFKSETVNKIICAEIIEHLNEPEQMIGETQRVLKNGGSIVITTPNEHSIWGLYEFFWDTFGRGRNYGETHLKFFSVRELEGFFPRYLRSHETLFLISPIFALSKNKTILHWGRIIDNSFERVNAGVIIVLCAKKRA
jgi:glycosyltransferase 2 family protein